MHGDPVLGSDGPPRQVTDGLAEIVRSACEAVDADGAGITLLQPDGRCMSIETTMPLVHTADQLQDESGEGPCTLAAKSITTISVDIASDTRWPQWGPAVAALGFCSLLSAQIRPDGHGIGVLTVYSARPRSFTIDETALTHMFARQAAVALIHDGQH